MRRSGMASNHDLRPVVAFTKALKRNNNREWFQSHRDDYELAKLRFEEFVADVIKGLARTEPLEDLSPRDCVFRIFRDVRFSKNKSPYKPNMGAYVAPGGRKSRGMGLYVHIESGASMLAGGMYMPEPAQLAAWREAIARDSRPFRTIIRRRAFRELFGDVDGERLKTAPRGYAKDHPDIDLLRLKSVTAARYVSDREVVAPDFLREALRSWKVMKPFAAYLDSFR